MAEEVESCIQKAFNNKVRLCVKNAARDAVEYIYELSEKQVAMYQTKHVSNSLFSIESVSEVNLVGQNEDISE